MKRDDLHRVAEALKEPMKAFVRESRVRTAILVTQAGQVLAQRGFSRGFDVSSVAALAAAAHASARPLAELTDSDRWNHLHHAGADTQLYLAPFRVGSDELILVAIFDDASTLGLVQLFFDRLVEAIHEIPELGAQLRSENADAFERDLEAGVERLLSESEED